MRPYILCDKTGGYGIRPYKFIYKAMDAKVFWIDGISETLEILTKLCYNEGNETTKGDHP